MLIENDNGIYDTDGGYWRLRYGPDGEVRIGTFPKERNTESQEKHMPSESLEEKLERLGTNLFLYQALLEECLSSLSKEQLDDVYRTSKEFSDLCGQEIQRRREK